MRENKIYELIVTFNNPIIEPFRRIQQNIFSDSMIDFSPMFALIFINILRSIIFTVLPL